MATMKRQATIYRCRGCGQFPAVKWVKGDIFNITCNTCDVHVEGVPQQAWTTVAPLWNKRYGALPREEEVAQLRRRITELESEVLRLRRERDGCKKQYDEIITTHNELHNTIGAHFFEHVPVDWAYVNPVQAVDKMVQHLVERWEEARCWSARWKAVAKAYRDDARLAGSDFNKRIDDLEERLVAENKFWTDRSRAQVREIDGLTHQLYNAKKEIAEMQDIMTGITSGQFAMYNEVVDELKALQGAIRMVFDASKSKLGAPSIFWVALGTPSDLPDDVKEAVELIRRVLNEDSSAHPSRCAYCGGEATATQVDQLNQPVFYPELQHIVECDCGMQATGATKQQAIKRWNEHMGSATP